MRFGAGVLQVVALAALLAGALLLAEDGSAEPDYWNLTVAAGNSLTLADGEFTVEGNVEVFGALVLDNCSFDMTNEFSAGENEIRIQSGGSLTVRDCSLAASANLTPVRAQYDQLIAADPDNAASYEESIETAFAQLNATTAFRVVLDDGELLLNRVDVSRGRLWLVGGTATLYDTRLEGEGSFPEGIGLFIEDTNFLASNLALDGYGTCLRAVGTVPVLSNLAYGNCTVQRTQEWWLTVTVADMAGELLEGVRVVQRDADGAHFSVAEPQPDGSYLDWYEEYRLLGNGSRVESQPRVFAEKHYELYSLLGVWEGKLEGNAQVNITVETNRSLLSFSEMRLEVEGQPVDPRQPVAKWSALTVSATLENPTDYRLFLRVQLAVNDVTGYASTWVEVAPRGNTSLELAWNVSLEGDLSLSLVVDNRTLPDSELRISRYLQVASTAPEAEEQEQPWLALLLLLTLAGGAAWALWSEDEPEAGDGVAEAGAAAAAEEEAESDGSGDGADAPADDSESDAHADVGSGDEDAKSAPPASADTDAESPDADD